MTASTPYRIIICERWQDYRPQLALSFIPKVESVSNLAIAYDFEAFGAGHLKAASPVSTNSGHSASAH